MIDPRTCGVLATCGRWANHRGHHGGFRVVDGIPPRLNEPNEVSIVRHPALSVREVEVLLGLMEGEGAKRVAGHLGVSEQTIKNHMTNVYRKLDVTGLVAAYRRLGWLAVNRDEVQQAVVETALRDQLDQALTNLTELRQALAGDVAEAS